MTFIILALCLWNAPVSGWALFFGPLLVLILRVLFLLNLVSVLALLSLSPHLF